jgi:hypothetical protein
MIDVDKLIDAADKPGVWHNGLAAFCTELAEQLKTKATEKAAKNNRGHKSYGEHIATAVVELNAVADALRKHATATAPPAGPIKCRATNQLGAVCLRTDAGHTSHTYPPVEPGHPAVAKPGEPTMCGIEDAYPTHREGDKPDRCVLPPHGRDMPHEGAWSKWPWQGTLGLVDGNDDPNPAITAYLKGERDDLGTEPMFSTDADLFDRSQAPGLFDDIPGVGTRVEGIVQAGTDPAYAQRVITDMTAPFIEPRGTVTVSGTVHAPDLYEKLAVPVTIELAGDSSDARRVMAGALEGFNIVKAGLSDRVETGPPMGPPATPLPGKPLSTVLEAGVQPDPFDNALPEAPKREGVWTGGAEPVAPDPRPLWLPSASLLAGGLYQVPTSIRTTQVRVGEACGLQYRLISRDGAPEVPSWANIGGSALHECARLIEFGIINGNPAETITDQDARETWGMIFPA